MGYYPDRGLHGRVVQAVAERIVRGDLAPGEVIVIEELEREFDVSLTVVRESLRVLAAKGLVGARPKRGTFVRPRGDWSMLDPDVLRWRFQQHASQQFFDDLAEVRAAIEPACARIAAERRGEPDVGALESALRSMSDAWDTDPSAVTEADLRFHCALLEATHNELFIAMEVLIEAALRTRDLLVYGSAHRSDSIPVHRAVLDAVRDEDPDRAARLMRELLDLATLDVKTLIEEREGRDR